MQTLNLKPERIALLLICVNICLLLNGDIYLPTLPYLQKDLMTTEFKAQLVIVIFMVGAIFSRLIWGPLSDRYGRRKILLVAIGLQTLSQLGLFLSPTIDWLIFWRTIQSFGAGIISVIGTAIIADLFKGERRARFLGLHEMSFPIAFVIAPIIGVFLYDLTDSWRSAFIFMLCVQGMAWVIFYYFLPETHKATSDERLHHAFKLYFKLFTDRHFILYNLISGIMIGSFMMFIVISPFIYMVDLGISLNDFTFFQFTPMLINISSALVYRYTVEIFGSDRLLKLSSKLLMILIPLYLIIGFGLIEITPYVVLAAVCIQSAIVPFFVPNIIARTVDLYPHIKGISSSASASIRSVCVSAAMLYGSYYIGSNVSMLFQTKCVFIIIVLFLFWLISGKHHKGF